MKMYKLVDGTTIASEAEVLNAYEIMTGIKATEITPEILSECKGVDAEINPSINDLFNSMLGRR